VDGITRYCEDFTAEVAENAENGMSLGKGTNDDVLP
jgi:hypothetical protein